MSLTAAQRGENPSPLEGEGGAHRASDGRVRGGAAERVSWRADARQTPRPAPSRKGRGILAAMLGPGRRHALPLLLLLALGFATPLMAVIWFSFVEPRTFNLISAPTLANYDTIVRETFYTSFLWSLGLAAVTVVLLALICYPVAYGLAKVFGRWSMLLSLLLTIPLFVSENVRLYGWVLFFIKNGVLLGTLKSLFGVDVDSALFTPPIIVFAMVYVYLPFMLFPMSLGISMVPRETVEAAADLGASRWQIFREIELPLAMPGMVIGCLLTFVLAAGAIAEFKVLGGQSVIPITHDIEIAFTYAQNWPLGCALAVLLMLVVGSLVIAVLRRLDLDRILGRR
jgi:spermidine/putrescine transport system permease protein